jgi:hypothetical protein
MIETRGVGRAVSSAIVALLLISLTGCGLVGGLKSAAGAGSSPKPSSAAQLFRWTPPPASAEVDCFDATASVPSAFKQEALTQLSEQLGVRGVAPGSGALTVYVRTLASNSFASSAELMTLQLPAVPPEPQLPTDPLMALPAKSTYEAAVGSWKAQAARAQQLVLSYAAQVRQIDLPLFHTSDAWGCLSAAANIFAPVSGKKVLNIISDLQVIGPQQRLASLSLPGVMVQIQMYCVQAAPCNARQASFRQALEKAGASSVTFSTGGAPIDYFPDGI